MSLVILVGRFLTKGILQFSGKIAKHIISSLHTAHFKEEEQEGKKTK